MNITFIKETFAQHPNPTPQIETQFGFGGFATLGDLTTVLIPLGFSIAAVMVIFYFLIGAFEMITSQGDKAHIVSARAKIYHAFIGLVLLLILYLAVQFVLFDVLGLTNLNII